MPTSSSNQVQNANQVQDTNERHINPLPRLRPHLSKMTRTKTGTRNDVSFICVLNLICILNLVGWTCGHELFFINLFVWNFICHVHYILNVSTLFCVQNAIYAMPRWVTRAAFFARWRFSRMNSMSALSYFESRLALMLNCLDESPGIKSTTLVSSADLNFKNGSCSVWVAGLC